MCLGYKGFTFSSPISDLASRLDSISIFPPSSKNANKKMSIMDIRMGCARSVYTISVVQCAARRANSPC